MPRTRSVGGSIRVPDEWPGMSGEFVVLDKDQHGSIVRAEVAQFVRKQDWRGVDDFSGGWWYSLVTDYDSFGDKAEWVGYR